MNNFYVNFQFIQADINFDGLNAFFFNFMNLWNMFFQMFLFSKT